MKTLNELKGKELTAFNNLKNYLNHLYNSTSTGYVPNGNEQKILFGKEVAKEYSIGGEKASKSKLIEFNFITSNEMGITWNGTSFCDDTKIIEYLTHIQKIKSKYTKKTPNKPKLISESPENISPDNNFENIIKLTPEIRLERAKFIVNNANTYTRGNSVKNTLQMLNVGAIQGKRNEIKSFDEMFIAPNANTGVEENYLNLSTFNKIVAFEMGLLKAYNFNKTTKEYEETSKISKSTKFRCNFTKEFENKKGIFLFGDEKIKIDEDELSNLVVSYSTLRTKTNNKQRFNEGSRLFEEKLKKLEEERVKKLEEEKLKLEEERVKPEIEETKPEKEETKINDPFLHEFLLDDDTNDIKNDEYYGIEWKKRMEKKINALIRLNIELLSKHNNKNDVNIVEEVVNVLLNKEKSKQISNDIQKAINDRENNNIVTNNGLI